MALSQEERAARHKLAKAKHRAKPAVKAAEREALRLWEVANRDRRNARRRERYGKDEAYRANILFQTSEAQKRRRPAINAGRAERRRNDPAFRLEYIVGSSIRRAASGKAGRRWTSIVGYSAEQLRDHISAQFEPWMTWENYGTAWHIDHRRPISSFDLPREAALCWSLANLRPLSGGENMSKKDKIVLEIIPDELRSSLLRKA